MRRGLIVALGILFSAGAALGQAGYIGLFSDIGYVECYLWDDEVGPKSLYAVHKAASGVTQSQFLVEVAPGFGCTEVGITYNFPTAIGSPTTGLTISYGACSVSDILLFTWDFQCQITSATCVKLEVVPDPAAMSGYIEVVDCNSNRLIGNGSTLYVNPNFTCDCGEIVPAEDTNWGQIKALYR
jgi:hypothetical protein